MYPMKPEPRFPLLMTRRVPVVIAVLATLVGCGSTPTLSGTDAARQISDQLEATVGRRPDAVECPEDMPAEIGATMRCELTDGESVYGVTIRITEVTDGVATFDIDVDQEPS